MQKMDSRPLLFKWIGLGLVLLILLGLYVTERRKSQVVGHSQYRFNMAMIEPETGITFISFDPTDRSILALPFPSNLAIASRSRGEYSIASLYKLGSYQGKGGMFARQKIQGFMRVPIPGYMVITGKHAKPKTMLRLALLRQAFGFKKLDSSLSRLDALLLLSHLGRYSWREVGEEELIRAAVIDKSGDNGLLYHPERLQQYVGTRFFDWGIGAEGVTVAILNESGENGLGSDMADFLSNLGLDVVMVRSGEGEPLPVSEWQVGSEANVAELSYIFQNLFGFHSAKIETVPSEYRSTVLIRVGKDAKELF